MSEERPDPLIDEVLAFMGVTRGTTQDIAYRHWRKFLELAKLRSGEDWEKVRNLMRSYVNVNKRYIDDYLESCQAWGTVKLNDGKIIYIGLPKGVVMPKGKPFPYGPPLERDHASASLPCVREMERVRESKRKRKKERKRENEKESVCGRKMGPSLALTKQIAPEPLNQVLPSFGEPGERGLRCCGECRGHPCRDCCHRCCCGWLCCRCSGAMGCCRALRRNKTRT